MINLPTIDLAWSELHGDASAWRKAKSKARSTSYNTNFRTDSGPKEFRVAKRALRNGRTFVNSTNEIYEGLIAAQTMPPKLLEDINNFIAIELDGAEGNGKKAGKELLDNFVHLYQANFKGGFDVDRFRFYMPLIWGIVGLAAGLGVGAALNHAGDRFGWYETRKVKDVFSRRNRYGYS